MLWMKSDFFRQAVYKLTRTATEIFLLFRLDLIITDSELCGNCQIEFNL